MINYQSKFLCKHSDVLKHLIQIPLELPQCERFIKIIILEALLRSGMNKTTFICLLLALCLLPSCAVQMICPAYQSAFILDDDARKETYSLLRSMMEILFRRGHMVFGLKSMMEIL